MGDQISAEMEIDDGWQSVFLCLRACACACVYLCFFGVATGGRGLSREITPLLGNRGAGFLFKGGPKSVPKEPRDYKTEIEPVD